MLPNKPCGARRVDDRRVLYRARNLVERFFNRIKQCRRVATRYDKLAANYLAFIKLASIRIWLRAHESTPWFGQAEALAMANYADPPCGLIRARGRSKYQHVSGGHDDRGKQQTCFSAVNIFG